jgi:antitoxin (DNA-binding transcriptional repressor) of toxin-antitoxin stability system
MTTVTATELARNTRRILDSVVQNGEMVSIERNHVPIAKLSPPETSTMTAAQALAGLQPMLTAEQATAWLIESKASKVGFGQAIDDPWA